MAFRASVDTCLSVSEAMPATYDEAGYDALSFTQVGEITSLGDWGGEYAVVEHQDICEGTVKKAKGSVNYGSQEIEVAIDPADAGQDILRDYHDGTNRYESLTVRIVDSWGTTFYYTAKVTNFSQSASGPDDVYMGNITFEIDRQILIVTAP